MKLNAVRHFYFVKDKQCFDAKKPIALFRGPCHKPHRKQFVQKCYNLPDTDIGDIKPAHKDQPYYKPPMTIKEHLQYKYIISVEGNDVATNLKWIMNANSLCFMTMPRYETWFMEGRLIPDYHFVLLKDDYSDLNEKIDYYNAHPEKAKAIIANAQAWTEQFKDKQAEKILNLMVLKKYFRLSGQM